MAAASSSAGRRLYSKTAGLNMAAIILNTALKPFRWLFFPDQGAVIPQRHSKIEQIQKIGFSLSGAKKWPLDEDER